jgi:hypothetical protein
MPFAEKVVLHTPSGYLPGLEAMVEQFIRDGVMLVAVVGKDCARIEDAVDAVVEDSGHFVLTSSHPDETLDEAVEFARCLTGEYAGDVEIVELG